MRIDFVFSYWVYFWYILYAFKITTFSPKFPMLLGLIDNIIMLLLMLLYGTQPSTIIQFVLINTIIKAIPLYFMINEPVQKRDIYATIILFTLFVIWLHINAETLTGNAKLIYTSLLYGKNKTPFMSFMKKLRYNFKHLRLI